MLEGPAHSFQTAHRARGGRGLYQFRAPAIVAGRPWHRTALLLRQAALAPARLCRAPAEFAAPICLCCPFRPAVCWNATTATVCPMRYCPMRLAPFPAELTTVEL